MEDSALHALPSCFTGNEKRKVKRWETFGIEIHNSALSDDSICPTQDMSTVSISLNFHFDLTTNLSIPGQLSLCSHTLWEASASLPVRGTLYF